MIRSVRQASGLFLALLAIVAQLTLAAVAPASAMSLAEATVLCQHDGNTDGPPPPAHPSPDCLLCFVCHGAQSPVGLITASPVLPEPTTILIARAATLPPATAPPLRIVLAAHPRGPPIPV
jgi:hypothetical protein